MNTLSHVAIIMDGNGRWAINRGKPRREGHLQGTRNVKKIIPFFVKQKIPYLTLFAFGIDNWSRPKSETSYIFYLFENFFNKNINYLLDNNIKIKFIGEKKKISKKIIKIIKKVEKKTEKKNGLTLVVAFNYSSKKEILNAFNQFSKKNKKKNVSEKSLQKYLYTSKLPNPDILIRTGNHIRISNFLLWQISYTEIFFEKKLWPDFNERDLKKIIFKFKKIKRNFGNI